MTWDHAMCFLCGLTAGAGIVAWRCGRVMIGTADMYQWRLFDFLRFQQTSGNRFVKDLINGDADEDDDPLEQWKRSSN